MNLLTTSKGFADVHSRNFSPAMVWGECIQRLVGSQSALMNWKGSRCSWLYHNIYSFQILKPQTRTFLSSLYACQSMTSRAVPCKPLFKLSCIKICTNVQLAPEFCGTCYRWPNCIPAPLNSAHLLSRPSHCACAPFRASMHGCVLASEEAAGGSQDGHRVASVG